MSCFQIAIACFGLMVAGCQNQPAPPTFPATSRITARVHSVPDMVIETIDHVEVPQQHIPKIMQLVTPVTYIESGIEPRLNYHVADVYLHHQDSNKVTTIEVRFTGHNPAAVTVDGGNYFYAPVDGRDGARALSILLAKYHFQAQ